MNPNQFFTHSLQDLRVGRILTAALKAVEPGEAVRRGLETVTIPKSASIHLLGIGKAAIPMTAAAAEILPDFEDGLVITKQANRREISKVRILETGHPLPDRRSLEAGRLALKYVGNFNEDDLLVCLLSGGGSSLVTYPLPGIELEDMQQLTGDLLASGAAIDEINILRRELDQVKGGGLAEATRARILNLILSDVLGDDLATIASGPCVPNPTRREDALAVLEKYKLTPTESIRQVLFRPRSRGIKPFHERTTSMIVGNNFTAIQAGQGQAETEGFKVRLLDTAMRGEARQVGDQLAKILAKGTRNAPRPFCWIAGGETTVTLRGHGKGGRNQELALAAVDELDGAAQVLLISLATDGNDGPTDAAGAVVSGETKGRASQAGMETSDYLAHNDAYPFFERLGDLLKPGYTSTNVNDLVFLFGF